MESALHFSALRARGVLLMMVLLGSRLAAAQSELPEIAQRGLTALDAGRIDSALAIWVRGSGFSDQARDQVLRSGPLFAEACGQVSAHDILRVVELSPHLKRLYILALCSTQPVYVMLVLYQGADHWVVTSINWNTDADRVLPASIFGAQRP